MESNSILLTLEDIIKNKNKKIVIAGYSAAEYWGFTPFINKKIELMTDKNYNPNIKNKNIKIMRRIIDNYKENIREITFEGTEYKITSKEFTFIEIYRRFNGNFNDQNMELCKLFFESSYDYKKLEQIAESKNIKREITLLRMMHGKKSI